MEYAFNRFVDHIDMKLFYGHLKKFKVTNEEILSFVDWRKRGAVTPVRNQGKCGSCWAFVTCAALEIYHYNKTGELIELSPQYLVDCADYAWFDKIREKCERGNDYGLVMKFVKTNGICREVDYPYRDASGKCGERKTLAKLYKIHELMYIFYDERAMKAALNVYGSLMASIRVQLSFFLYEDGVYSEKKCGEFGHSVLIVGHGTDPKHGPYWLVKNSWGVGWGDWGYIRVTQDSKKNCGLSSIVYFFK